MRQELAPQPPELPGRDKLLKDAAIDMDRVLDRRPTKGMMLLGFRGVGKTVLLNRLHSMAEQKGLRTAKVEAPEGGMLPQLLTLELRQVLYSLDLEASAGQKVR
jgi:Cdc6-like AAA superfamily ATPase